MFLRTYPARVFETVAATARCTSEGTILEANRAMALLLGRRFDDEIAGLSFADLAPKQWPRIEETLIRNGRIDSAELALTRRDGSTVWLIVSMARVETGGPPLIDVVALDITYKKRREDSYLRQAEIESAISAIYSDLLFTDADQIEVAIERGLHRVGIYTGAVRAHFFTMVDDRRFRSDFEWCADGMAHRFDKRRIVPATALGGLLEHFRTSRSVTASHLVEMHPFVRRLLVKESIGSVVVAPMFGEPFALVPR